MKLYGALVEALKLSAVGSHIAQQAIEAIQYLDGELSLAEEGLANYAQEIASLRNDLTAVQLECSAYQRQLEAVLQINQRLRAGLLGHACYCGSSDPDPAAHREDCSYRKWASPESSTPPQT